ncbi:NAD(P)H-binding protein [Psychromonas antarctica]|jgi:uncharacterized protein YbjT (DUF2867 family)|uniref:NAD(P)H-binding protein n=1 Tax=Psychromonas antarctica TaxID=67573 RepID=UPI001EE84EC2|nr:NAD(P)H-binding protein [Psychromonas antarctica]MCG6202673.1 NAD(P)H-binding protein [Psychromonas antarctica]
MGKIAIVIGATGLVGRALVDQLVNAENISKIVTLTRRSDTHLSPKVFNQIVDFDNLERHDKSFNGDFLFSCLGTTIKQAGSIAAQRKVDLDYQFKAAQLAASNGVDHYLLVSSSGANEKSNSEYLKMKGELEQKIKALPFKRISIFQPSLLLGQRAELRLGEKIASWVMIVLRVIPWLRRFRPITGEQVATKMVVVSKQSGRSIEFFRLDDIFIN